MSLKLAVVNGKKEIGNMSRDELIEAQQIAIGMSFEQRGEFYEKLLQKAIPAYAESVREPFWLKSDFDDPVWECKFGKVEKKIDFNVKLDDGQPLTSGKHRETLDAMKYWLCTLTHPRYCSGRNLAASFALTKILKGLHILDMILIRARRFSIAEHGFSLINSNDILSLLVIISRGVEGMYDFSNQVSRFLALQVQAVSRFEMTLASEKYPNIVDAPRTQKLNLSSEQIVKARVWLLNQSVENELFSPSKDDLAANVLFKKALFRNTLQGMNINFPVFPELRIAPNKMLTEYPRVPASTKKDEGISSTQLNSYVGQLRSLASLDDHGYKGLPADSVAELNWSTVKGFVAVANQGRYRTLPADVVFESLNNAFEFCFKYADDILNSVASFLEYAPSITSARSQQKIDRNDAAIRFASPKLRKLGVKGWRIPTRGDDYLTGEDYFSRLRANEGLAELYQVLLGSIQVIIGAMMARRVSELSKLKSNCLLPNKNPLLDENKQVGFSLVFDNLKSGEGEEREELARPILLSGARIVWKLQQFRKRLVTAGVVSDSDGLLLALDPRLVAIQSIKLKNQYYRSLDAFSDYFETKLISMGDGELYRCYIRPHQLRRFFAMAFFWGSGFAGLDTLRYFLGHADAEHLYHYITESTPGTVLRGAKADVLVHGIDRDEIENIDKLREMLKKRFGVSDLQIQSLEEVTELLSEDVQDGVLKTEPPLSKLRAEVEKDIFQLIEEGTIDLEPTFANVVSDEGETVQQVHLVLKIEGLDDGG